MTILRLTDGTSTVDLIWHSTANRKYILARDDWAPSVAGRRQSLLGSKGLYNDVLEDITIHVCGDTANDAMVNLELVMRLLDQAEDWRRGDRSTPTRLQYAPTGGTLREAIILGRPFDEEANALSLAETFNSNLNAFTLENIHLRFLRTGAWLLPTVDTAASAAGAHPSILSATFATSHPTLSPVDLTLSGFTRVDVPFFQYGYWVIAPASRITLGEGETIGWSMSSGLATATVTADAAGKASGGNVRRLAGNISSYDGVVPVSGSPHRVAVFAAVRVNNSATVATAYAIGNSNGTLVANTTAQNISYNGGLPQLLNLGTLITREDLTSIFARITITTLGANGIDCDYVVAVDMADEQSRILALNDPYSARFASLAAGTAATASVLSNALTEPSPGIKLACSTQSAYVTYSGDAYVSVAGNNIAMLLMTSGSAFWTPGAAVTSVLTASRYKAAIVPQ